jgi:hypothetical protein
LQGGENAMEKGTLQQQFRDHGFEGVEYIGKSTYRLNIISEVTGASYPLFVNTAASEQGGMAIHFEEDVEKNDTVPLQVRSAVLDKLAKVSCETSLD